VKQRDYADAKYIPVAKYGGQEFVFVVHKPTRAEIKQQEEKERREREWKAKELWMKQRGTEHLIKISGRNEPQVPVKLPHLLGRDTDGKRYVLNRGDVFKPGHRWSWEDRWEGLEIQVIEKKHRRPSGSLGIDEFLESPNHPQLIKDKVKPFQQYDYKKAEIRPWETYVDKQKAEEVVKQSEKTGTIPSRYYGSPKKGRLVLIDWHKPDTVELKKIIRARGLENVDEVKFSNVDAPYAVYELEEKSS